MDRSLILTSNQGHPSCPLDLNASGPLDLNASGQVNPLDLKPCGLANLGNTCFLNSCIQVLVSISELHKIPPPNTKPDEADTKLFTEFHSLAKMLSAAPPNSIISPNRFVYSTQEFARQKRREIFTGWAQNDITEFLLFIIECMHNSISRSVKVNLKGTPGNTQDDLAVQCFSMVKEHYSKDYSEIMDLCFGVYVSRILSVDETITHSLKPEFFFILDLPIPPQSKNPKIHLYDCFDEFIKTEHLYGENAWMNETTKQLEDIHKHILFWSFPDILVIALKRFSADGQAKNGVFVDFPIQSLDLSKYVSGYNANSYVYNLVGVCNHMGGVMGGHYTAFSTRDNVNWWHFNDTQVDLVSPAQIISPMAYCLFYRKTK